MSETYDKVLDRLGEWQYNRARKHYTPKVAEQVKLKVEKEMRKSKELSDLVSKEVLEELSVEKIVERSRTYWVQIYKTEEMISLGLSTPDFNFESVSKDDLEVFFKPDMENYYKLVSFVRKVRKVYEKDKRITDSEIDKIFLRHFKGLGGFIEFSLEESRRSTGIFYALNKDAPLSLLRLKQESERVFSELIPYFSKILFPDLEVVK